MTYGEALELIKTGSTAARPGWPDGAYIAWSPGFVLQPSRVFSEAIKTELESRKDTTGTFLPYVMYRDQNGAFVPFCLGMEDEDDWYAVNEVTK